MELEPVDEERCQADGPNPEWSPFRLGPVPKRVRCSNMPVWVATEKEPGKDGLRGSMSLCQPCKEVCDEQLAGQIEYKAIVRQAA